MDTFLQDVRYGVRMLAKSPGFTAVAILTLTLGIGANTAIFSVINAELLRPLPYPHSDRLVNVATTNSKLHSGDGAVSYPDFADWRSQSHVFDGMAAYTDATAALTGQDNPAHLLGVNMSDNTFDLLGATPALGRTFLPDEDQPHHFVIVLSDQMWRNQFGADPNILGRTIRLDGDAYTVVGVMPPNFRFPLRREPSQFWTTMSPLLTVSEAQQHPIAEQREGHFLNAFARLKPGVTVAQAQADLDVISASLAKQYPDSNKYVSAIVELEQARLTKAVRPALLVLMIAVSLVLLIACVNVANLLLARSTSRGREIAIRTALGAGRTRVIRQLLTESLLLATCAGVLGSALAVWGSALLVRYSPQSLPQLGDVQVDGWTLAFTAGISLFTGMLFGLAPALQVSRSSVTDALKEGALSTTAGRGRHGLLSGLVIVEIALALVLLVSASLLVRSLMHLQDVNPGFDAHGVMTADLDLPDAKYPDAQKGVFANALLEKLKAIPGVQQAALVYPLPMGGDEIRTVFQIEGHPVPKSEQPHTHFRVASPGYFSAMHIPLKRGRDIRETDTMNTPTVIVVNESFVRQFFPNEDPIGKRIQPGVFSNTNTAEFREIVGVVGDVRFQGPNSEVQPEAYVPYAQLPFGTFTIVARSANNPGALARPIAAAVQSLDKDLPAYSSATAEEYLSDTIAVPKLNTYLLTVFAILAMVLTAVGLFGVISYSVAQRTRELGIRMALGGKPSDMLRLVIGQGVRLALLGIGVGLVAAIALTRFLSSLLFGVSSTDPLSFIAVVAMLLIVVVLACYLPARRGSRVDPMVALRCE